MFIYLDDLRPLPGDKLGWAVARTDFEFKTMVRNCCASGGKIQAVSFDHDLGLIEVETGEEITGLTLAKWLVEMDLDSNFKTLSEDFLFYVHSANPPGAKNIESYLRNYLRYRETPPE